MDGNFVAGADPEVMVIDQEGALVSTIPLIKGTKEKPQPTESGAVQRDNVLAEFNVKPAHSSEEFEHNMREVLRDLAKLLAPRRLLVRASAEYPEEELEHPEARVFGCDPDFNAWTLMMNVFDGTAAYESFRSAGAHLHLGSKPNTEEMLKDPYGKVAVIKALDVFLGIPSVILDTDPTAPARRALYGGAGAHRPKDYGVEYRSLGNFWIRSPELVSLIYRLADQAVNCTLNGESDEMIARAGGEKIIVRTINTCNKRAARKIVREKLGDILPVQEIEELANKETELYSAWGI